MASYVRREGHSGTSPVESRRYQGAFSATFGMHSVEEHLNTFSFHEVTGGWR